MSDRKITLSLDLQVVATMTDPRVRRVDLIGDPVRVLVTGSRDWKDPRPIHEALELLETRAWPARLLVVHGHCPTGADAIAARWCIDRVSSDQPCPADWNRHGKAAGFVRNAEMVAAGASVCLAFIRPCPKPNCPHPQPHGSHGACDCADRAARAGIPTIHWPAS